MVAGPELVRITSEFEASTEGSKNAQSEKTQHFEQRHAFQATFIHHVQQMTDSLEEMGNLFLEETTDLMRLDTRDIIDSAVITSVFQVEEIGKQ